MQGIPERINIIKQHFRLNNVQLGEVAGVGKAAVGRWINESIVPSGPSLVRMRERLGVNESWVIEGKGEMLVSIPDDKFIDAMKDVSGVLRDEQKAQLLDMARYFAHKAAEHKE